MYNIRAVKELGRDTVTNNKFYGNKIGVLSILAGNNINVPKGFYFAIERGKANSQNYKAQIESIYKNLKLEKNTNLIVRSSMSLEDKISHQFPGIFKSKKNLSSFKEVKQAIEECVKSKTSDLAYRYVDPLKSVRLNDVNVSILIQEQIEVSLFGLAEIKNNEFDTDEDYINIELTKEDSLRLVNGNIVPSAIRLYRENNKSIIGNTEDIDFEKINFTNLNREFQKIRKVFPKDCIVEFGIDVNGNCYIFQAREHEIKGINPLRAHITDQEKPDIDNTKSIILEDEKKYGLKGAAMKYFQKNKLFEAELLLLESTKTLTRIKEIIRNESFCQSALTMRFSKGDEIGLKRFFCSNGESAIGDLVKYYPEFKKLEQLLILHPYLNVRHSYELLLDNDYFVIEHIPGLWEANNTLEPDVIYFDKQKKEAELLLVKDKRQQIISSPYSTDREYVAPLTLNFFEPRIKRFFKFQELLFKDFKSNLPLNFHFVETDSGEIAFLNIRRLSITRKMFENRRYVRDGSFCHIRKIEDIDGWDQRSPILLRLSTDRGREKEFIDLALALPKNVEVYINFGWLSHPAMILREYGVHLIPAYLNRSIKKITYDN